MQVGSGASAVVDVERRSGNSAIQFLNKPNGLTPKTLGVFSGVTAVHTPKFGTLVGDGKDFLVKGSQAGSDGYVVVNFFSASGAENGEPYVGYNFSQGQGLRIRDSVRFSGIQFTFAVRDLPSSDRFVFAVASGNEVVVIEGPKAGLQAYALTSTDFDVSGIMPNGWNRYVLSQTGTGVTDLNFGEDTLLVHTPRSQKSYVVKLSALGGSGNYSLDTNSAYSQKIIGQAGNGVSNNEIAYIGSERYVIGNPDSTSPQVVLLDAKQLTWSGGADIDVSAVTLDPAIVGVLHAGSGDTTWFAEKLAYVCERMTTVPQVYSGCYVSIGAKVGSVLIPVELIQGRLNLDNLRSSSQGNLPAQYARFTNVDPIFGGIDNVALEFRADGFSDTGVVGRQRLFFIDTSLHSQRALYSMDPNSFFSSSGDLSSLQDPTNSNSFTVSATGDGSQLKYVVIGVTLDGCNFLMMVPELEPPIAIKGACAMPDTTVIPTPLQDAASSAASSTVLPGANGDSSAFAQATAVPTGGAGSPGQSAGAGGGGNSAGFGPGQTAGAQATGGGNVGGSGGNGQGASSAAAPQTTVAAAAQTSAATPQTTGDAAATTAVVQTSAAAPPAVTSAAEQQPAQTTGNAAATTAVGQAPPTQTSNGAVPPAAATSAVGQNPAQTSVAPIVGPGGNGSDETSAAVARTSAAAPPAVTSAAGQQPVQTTGNAAATTAAGQAPAQTSAAAPPAATSAAPIVGPGGNGSDETSAAVAQTSAAAPPAVTSAVAVPPAQTTGDAAAATTAAQAPPAAQTSAAATSAAATTAAQAPVAATTDVALAQTSAATPAQTTAAVTSANIAQTLSAAAAAATSAAGAALTATASATGAPAQITDVNGNPIVGGDANAAPSEASEWGIWAAVAGVGALIAILVYGVRRHQKKQQNAVKFNDARGDGSLERDSMVLAPLASRRTATTLLDDEHGHRTVQMEDAHGGNDHLSGSPTASYHGSGSANSSSPPRQNSDGSPSSEDRAAFTAIPMPHVGDDDADDLFGGDVSDIDEMLEPVYELLNDAQLGHVETQQDTLQRELSFVSAELLASGLTESSRPNQDFHDRSVREISDAMAVIDDDDALPRAIQRLKAEAVNDSGKLLGLRSAISSALTGLNEAAGYQNAPSEAYAQRNVYGNAAPDVPSSARPSTTSNRSLLRRDSTVLARGSEEEAARERAEQDTQVQRVHDEALTLALAGQGLDETQITAVLATLNSKVSQFKAASNTALSQLGAATASRGGPNRALRDGDGHASGLRQRPRMATALAGTRTSYAPAQIIRRESMEVPPAGEQSV